MIYNYRTNLSRAINAKILLVIDKISISRYAVGWFCNHPFDIGINCTQAIRSITIINTPSSFANPYKHLLTHTDVFSYYL